MGYNVRNRKEKGVIPVVLVKGINITYMASDAVRCTCTITISLIMGICLRSTQSA